jgi:hypothetical protein
MKDVSLFLLFYPFCLLFLVGEGWFEIQVWF